MKTQKTFTRLFFMVTFSGTLIISCKKGNDKKPTCHIITITEASSSGNTIYNISYNNDGKISTLNATGSSVSNKVFNYSGMIC